jgi:hypothetical protein
MPPNLSISYGRPSESSISEGTWWQAPGDHNTIYIQKGAEVHLACNIQGLGDSGPASCLFTINPHLPSGLSFNPRTGGITGVPTAASEQKQYTITCLHKLDNNNDDEGTKESTHLRLTVREPTPEFSARFSKMIQLQVGKHMETILLLVMHV